MTKEVLEWMKKSGAPANILADAEKSYLMQSDYTKNSQALAEKERALAFYAGQLQAQAPQQGAAAGRGTSRLDQYLTELGEDEQGQTLRNLLGPGFQALREDVGQENQQIKKALVFIQKMNEVKSRLEEDLVGKYGEEIREVFPKVQGRIQERLLQGQDVHPEQALWEVDEAAARRALLDKEKRTSEQRSKETLGGFESVRRTSPAMGGVGSPASPEGEAAVGSSAKELDFEALYFDIANDLGISG